jgi:hypothetical protein
VLLIVNTIVFLRTREDTRLAEVKERYRILREHLIASGDEEFTVLHKEIPIVAHTRISYAVGYNSGKGDEIGLCIDGTTNDIFHVLLHELAHCTVDEYSHSNHFWMQFEKLRGEAMTLGIYTHIPTKTPFCGQYIVDK